MEKMKSMLIGRAQQFAVGKLSPADTRGVNRLTRPEQGNQTKRDIIIQQETDDGHASARMR
jgi:hypothetical protein